MGKKIGTKDRSFSCPGIRTEAVMCLQIKTIKDKFHLVSCVPQPPLTSLAVGRLAMSGDSSGHHSLREVGVATVFSW